MKEYIIHRTSYENLVHILKSGCKKRRTFNGRTISKSNIYTIIISKLIKWKYSISTLVSILKDYPFYATSIWGFKKIFSDAFSKE